MELKDEYKDGKSTIFKNGNRTPIVNDPKKFKLYKLLGLDVFKTKRKKKVDSTTEK
jgi:hypothetical protein